MPGSQEQIVGEAVVGSGQYLAFTPCCRRSVRLAAEEVRPSNAVRCSKDSLLWALSFVKRGVDWVAVWTP